MKLLIASNNKGKLREFKEILGGLFMDMVTPGDIGLSLDVEENGDTFEQNALIKARAYAAASNLCTIADDSGLCVDALDGAPGVLSARFAGKHGDDEANNRLLIQKLRGVPRERRTARYAVSIAFVGLDGTQITSEGTCEGRIMLEPVGENGFGYDPLFYTEVYGRSFAQITPDQKNAISHRGEALRKMRALLEKHYG